MTININDFVTAVASGNLSQANNMFDELMHDRLSQSLDDKKIELAQGIIGVVDSEEEDNENDEVYEVSGSD